MINQALFSSKDKGKNLISSAAILFGALRVNTASKWKSSMAISCKKKTIFKHIVDSDETINTGQLTISGKATLP